MSREGEVWENTGTGFCFCVVGERETNGTHPSLILVDPFTKEDEGTVKGVFELGPGTWEGIVGMRRVA